MAVFHFSLLGALVQRFFPIFPPTHLQPSLSGNKWHQYPDDTSFMIPKMAFLTLSLAVKTTLLWVCCWHAGSFRSTLIDTDCFIETRESVTPTCPHMYEHLMLLHTHTDRLVPILFLFLFKLSSNSDKVQEQMVQHSWITGRRWAVITQIKPFSEMLSKCFIVN